MSYKPAQVPNWQAMFDGFAKKNATKIKRLRAKNAKTVVPLEDAKIVNHRFVPAPENASPGDQYVVTNVAGNSLASAGIQDGDWIMWKRTGDASHGDLVVVETPRGTTVKFFFFNGTTVRLSSKPNDPMGIRFHLSEITIRGVVVTSGRDWTKRGV